MAAEGMGSSKRQRRSRRVVYVAMAFRLLGIDLGELEQRSKSYVSKSYEFPDAPIVCEVDYKKDGLPWCMGVFAVDESSFYLVGGEYPHKDFRKYGIGRFDENNMPRNIYRFNPLEGTTAAAASSSYPVAPVLLEDAHLISPKPRPIVETFAGITYVISRDALSVWGDYDYPSPFIEGLDVSGSSVKSLPVQDNIVRRGLIGRWAVRRHYVVGNKIFLIMLDKRPPLAYSLACFDTATGFWKYVSDNVLYSFGGFLLPDGGSSVSICGDAGDVVVIGNGRCHVLLFYTNFSGGLDKIRYYAGLVAADSGVLHCYQEFTNEIFKPGHMELPYMEMFECHFTDAGGGRVYAATTSVAAPGSILCVSEFSIRKSSTADQIALESFNSIGPAREAKFVDIVHAKNCICRMKTESMHNVSRAFVLEIPHIKNTRGHFQLEERRRAVEADESNFELQNKRALETAENNFQQALEKIEGNFRKLWND
ncbi:hypothetical protein AKJ16_DCAP03464 [Drosera capensis]